MHCHAAEAVWLEAAALLQGIQQALQGLQAATKQLV